MAPTFRHLGTLEAYDHMSLSLIYRVTPCRMPEDTLPSRKIKIKKKKLFYSACVYSTIEIEHFYLNPYKIIRMSQIGENVPENAIITFSLSLHSYQQSITQNN